MLWHYNFGKVWLTIEKRFVHGGCTQWNKSGKDEYSKSFEIKSCQGTARQHR